MTQAETNAALFIAYRKRKIILIFAGIMSFSAAIFTTPYFIHPVYKSETLLYPPSSNSNKYMIAGASRFGSDKEIDEQIQIFKSTEVRDSIIKKYGLVKHYKIDTLERTWSYRLYKKYDGNVSIDRTRYNSISIVVFDTDPEMAAEMANHIVKFGDGVKNKIIKKNLLTAFEALTQQYAIKVREVDSIAERINNVAGEVLFSPMPFGRKTDLEKLRDQVAVREMMNKAKAKKDYALQELLFGFENRLNQLNDLHESYSQAYIDYSSPVPESYVVSRAEASYKKVSPMRTVIILLTFLGSIIILSAWIVFYEKYLPFFRQLK
ncbi:MAG TPA: Wzz/FepE/Etk N-terminal domain-containing protein [Bacteroidia bacterium]|nr:Wzz/FepE/Etk N-terminal domain-containing protein [Bacteroidia bacterium]